MNMIVIPCMMVVVGLSGVCLSRKMFYPDSSSVNSQRADRVILQNSCAIMPTECKADLINKLQEYGESVSSSMTVLQLKARLAELKESDKESDRQVLKSKIQALNKAAKKKAHIMEMAEKEGIP